MTDPSSEPAEHGVRLPTMTALVDRLERDGLAARGRDASDARVVTVETTDADAFAAVAAFMGIGLVFFGWGVLVALSGQEAPLPAKA
ncbi:hypothetical protein ACFVH6_17795 [Spirillospora sp. NPDC127200]